MRIVFFLLLCCGLFFCLQSEVVAEQEVTLKSIIFEAGNDGVETVTFTLTSNNVPKIFMLSGDKPRLVMDFMDANYQGDSRITVDGATLVQGIRIGAHKQPQMKTRVVIDLTKDRKVNWSRKYNDLTNTLSIDLRAVETIDVAKHKEKVIAAPPKPAQDTSDKVATGPAEKEADAPKVSGDVKVAGSTPQKALVAEEPEESPIEKKTPVVSAKKNESAKETETVTAVKDIAKVHPEIPSLLDVSFDGSSKKGEMILFKLDDFHPPVVSAIEKGVPRIVCDFYNMRMAGQIKGTIDVGGAYVDKIRVARHENPGKVRAVLDLVPGNDYDLQQVFFNEDNLFVLIVNILGADGEKKAIQ